MLVTILSVLFVICAVFLGIFVLIQQGKGDMGMGSLGGSAQMLFGGSGGQTFFEKTTWTLGLIFMFGAIGLSILKSRELRKSRLDGFTPTTQSQQEKQPASAPLKDISTESSQAPAA